MLIDIKIFIRQLLLPNWRTPDYIGLAQVLFQPVQLVLRGQEVYEQTLLFRAGLTGQKLMLEHYLQTTVEGSIYLQDEDGAKLDFTVLVPQTLNAEKRKQVRDIVQTYKLASKRFEVRDVFAVSFGPEIPSTPAWSDGYPKKGDNKILMAVTVTGSYPVRIRMRGQSTYLVNDTISFIGNQALASPTAPAGVYDIEVGGLIASIDLTLPTQRVCDLTLWLSRPEGPALQIKQVNGVRRVTAYLYSSYADLDPFKFSVLDFDVNTGIAGAVLFSKSNILNPQPIVVDLPNSIAAGEYILRWEDKDGCQTNNRWAIPAPVTNPVCTIAFDDSAGTDTAVVATTVSQQYQLLVKVKLSQTNDRIVKVMRNDNSPILSVGMSGSSQMIPLPSGTTQQTIKVEVTEGECSTGVRTLVLPALPVVSLVASFARTNLIKITKGAGGKWSDTETDQIGPYDAWYLVSNVLYLDDAGNRKKFENEEFAAGMSIMVDKVFLDRGFFNTAQRVKDEMYMAQMQPGYHPEWISYHCQHKFTT